MATRVGGFLRRRVADAFLVVVWLVVLFQIVQIVRIEDASTTRTLLSTAVMVLIGVAATWLWGRTRRTTDTAGRS